MNWGIFLGLLVWLVLFGIPSLVRAVRGRRERAETYRVIVIREEQEARTPITVSLPTESASLLDDDPEIEWSEVWLGEDVGFMNPLTGEIVVPGIATNKNSR